jgi:hypothetical protein
VIINQTRSSVLSGRIALVVSIILMTWFSPAAQALANTADGQLKPTFGNGGKVGSNIGFPFDIAGAVAIQKDGKTARSDVRSQRLDGDGSRPTRLATCSWRRSPWPFMTGRSSPLAITSWMNSRCPTAFTSLARVI